MPFLSEADQDQLRTIFAEQLDRTVRLRLLTRPQSKLYIPGQQRCASCAEAEPFVRELATLSDKLQVVVHNATDEPEAARLYSAQGLLPVIQLEPVAADDPPAEVETRSAGAIRFVGLPAGYEFSTLVADIVDISTGHTDLSAAAQTELRALDQDLHLQVFVTPT